MTACLSDRLGDAAHGAASPSFHDPLVEIEWPWWRDGLFGQAVSRGRSVSAESHGAVERPETDRPRASGC